MGKFHFPVSILTKVAYLGTFWEGSKAEGEGEGGSTLPRHPRLHGNPLSSTALEHPALTAFHLPVTLTLKVLES